MSFNSKTGKTINPGKASKWTISWKKKHNNATESVFFGKEQTQNLLNTAGGTGIRIHFAIDDEGKETLILIPSDEKGSNIIQSGQGERQSKSNLSDLAEVEETSATVLNGGKLCPPYCDIDDID